MQLTLPSLDISLAFLDIAQGSYHSLLAKPDGWLACMVKSHSSPASDSKSPKSPRPKAPTAGDTKTVGGEGGATQPEKKAAGDRAAGTVLVAKEARKAGAVTLKTYIAYFTAVCPPLPFHCLCNVLLMSLTTFPVLAGWEHVAGAVDAAFRLRRPGALQPVHSVLAIQVGSSSPSPPLL